MLLPNETCIDGGQLADTVVGDLVLAGAWTAAADLVAGSNARASSASLGSISPTMSPIPKIM